MDVLSYLHAGIQILIQKLVIVRSFSQNHQRGQVLLIVVLTMVVALTVGLSVVSRTISNLKTSKQNEESQRAFQAAESGIDQALKQFQTGGGIDVIETKLLNNADYTVDFKTNADGVTHLKNGEFVDQTVGHDVWLSDYPNFENSYTGNITVHFNSEAQNCAGTPSNTNVSASLEILVLQGTKESPTFKKYIVDPCSPSRIPGASSGVSGVHQVIDKRYNNSYDLVAISNGLVMKIVPIFNSTPVAVSFGNARGCTDCTPYPAQGIIITSEGKSGDAVRKIQHFSEYPQIPNEIFPYSIISQ